MAPVILRVLAALSEPPLPPLPPLPALPVVVPSGLSEPWPSGSSSSPRQVKEPLMTELSLYCWNSEQASSRFWLDWRLKAPRTSLSLGKSALKMLLDNCAVLDRNGRENLRVNGITVHVEGTTNGLELGEGANVGELGVVLDGKTATDSGELGERDVGNGLVAGDGESGTDVSQVGETEALEEVAAEEKGVVDGGERGHADGRGVVDLNGLAPLQVGEGGGDVAAVGVDPEGLADIAELHGDVVKVAVVLDVDLVGDLEINALQGAQVGVDDGDDTSLLDLVGEGEALKTGQTLPLDLVNLVELGEVEVGENLAGHQAEGTTDALEAVSGDGGDLGDVVGDKVAGDGTDAIELDVVGGAGGNGDAAREGGAGGEARGVTLVLDGGGGGAARLSCGLSASCSGELFAWCPRVSALTCHTASDGHNGREVLEGHF